MRKIPTLFERDENDRRYVTRVPTVDYTWVAAGTGVPTRKWDGTCVMNIHGRWWARREVKPGKQPPPDFTLVDADDVTGKRFGWQPSGDSSYAKQLAAVLADGYCYPDGTYELCGPSVNGNHDDLPGDRLIQHGRHVLDVPDRSYDGLLAFFVANPGMEGIVFWRTPADVAGDLVKIKARDFRELAS